MIGIFDSGLGGLTVVKELAKQLPGFDIVYFGDTARTPYGTKGAEAVRKFSKENADFLLSQGAKCIVVACNTASAFAIDALRQHVSVPVFEVVTPAAEKAASITKGKIGVIGTSGTITSGAYQAALATLTPTSVVTAEACPLFVSLVEEGWYATPEATSIAQRYLNKLKLAQIDTLILGCTHYPFLRPTIARIMGDEVTLVDPAVETVKKLAVTLTEHPALSVTLGKNGTSTFFVSDRTARFEQLASEWLGNPIRLEIYR